MNILYICICIVEFAPKQIEYLLKKLELTETSGFEKPTSYLYF